MIANPDSATKFMSIRQYIDIEIFKVLLTRVSHADKPALERMIATAHEISDMFVEYQSTKG